MRSFQSNDRSNPALKFIFTGLAALTLLFAICIVFSVWYYIRKRREEKLRRSQQVENTFSERLASRSVAGKSSSKIDVGFTSQQTLNQDPENGEKRPTLSRFLRLWKGLRNSTRKASTDEGTKSVVFTIPTEDVYPKAPARQQTYHQDAVTQTDGFKTHLCEVHPVTHDIIEDCSSHDLHHLEDELDVMCDNEMETCQVEACQVEATTRISNNKSESTESSPTHAGDHTNAPAKKTGDEKYLESKEEKSFTKESDVDSGCGSSCHEIYAAEPPITHAQLNVSSLVYCHAQKMEANENENFLDNVSSTLHQSKELEKSEASSTSRIPCETMRASKEEWSEFQKSEPASDSFEELIKLAKDGMSTLARKRVDGNGKKNNISNYFQGATPTDNICKTRDASTNTDIALSNEKGFDLRTESQLCLDAQKKNCGVRSASSASLRSDALNKIGQILQSEENQSDSSCGKTLLSEITEKHAQKSIDRIPQYANADQSQMPMGKIAYNTTTDSEPNEKSTSSTALFEIPIIAVNNLLETANENPKPCSIEDSLSDEMKMVNKEQCKPESSQEDTDKTCCNHGETSLSRQKVVTFDKPLHMPLRIQDSLLRNGQLPEQKNRPKSLVLPSGNENDDACKSLYGSKAPSLETLDLPSQTTDHTGRIRSFSATIRRKLSFRERNSPDDTDIEKQGEVEAKNKKLKGFRSFRVNRKKKTKALKSEEISHSVGCLSDSKNYSSTIDKMFHENTGSAIFSDVPFTIPEISE